MNCYKCGLDIEEGHVFCESCLEVMSRYPVKPNTAIQLPHRETAPVVKKLQPKRRQPPTPEEKIHSMKRYLRRMLVLWLITLGLLIASLYPAARFFMGDAFRLPGQNYSTFSTIPAESTAPAESTTTP